MSDPPRPPDELVEAIHELHRRIRSATWDIVRRAQPDELLTEEQAPRESRDAMLRVDLPGTRLVGEFFHEHAGGLPPLTIVAEGLDEFETRPARGTQRWIVIVDPVDGSRELGKGRSAWALTGIAPDHGAATTLRDVIVGVQTELPPARQSESLVLSAIAAGGASVRSWDMGSGSWVLGPRPLHSSTASSVRGGVVGLANYFPGASELNGRVIDRALRRALGSPRRGQAQVFFDAYISTGGYIAHLALGQLRLHVDVRPALDRVLARRGRSVGLCAKPYDLSTVLIAEEAGAIIRDEEDLPLQYPLDTTTDCLSIGYANEDIRREVRAAIAEELRRATD